MSRIVARCLPTLTILLALVASALPASASAQSCPGLGVEYQHGYPLVTVTARHISCEATLVQVYDPLQSKDREADEWRLPAFHHHFWLTVGAWRSDAQRLAHVKVPTVHWQCTVHKINIITGHSQQGRTVVDCSHKQQRVRVLLKFRPFFYQPPRESTRALCQREYKRWREREARAIAEGKPPSSVSPPPAVCQA